MRLVQTTKTSLGQDDIQVWAKTTYKFGHRQHTSLGQDDIQGIKITFIKCEGHSKVILIMKI